MKIAAACARKGAWLVLGSLLSQPASGAEPPRELEALRRAIEIRRERVSAYERRERGLFEAIEAVDEAIRALRVDVSRAARRAQESQVRLRELQAQSVDLEQRLAGTREALGQRAVALYKAGELGPVRLVFAPGSLRDRLGRIQALQRLADHDARLLGRYREESAALFRARTDAEDAARAHEAASERLAARTAALEDERATKRELLLEVRRDRARERALLNELEAAAKALEETLSHLRELPVPPGAPPGTGFARRRGRLEAPVAGPLLRPFGRVVDREYRTQTFRKGVDFRVAVGEPVYAVADGLARFAGWFRGYGKLVILDHGEDYYTVSGHLDEIRVEVGDRVREGDPIGTAGETGSLSGPLLYFEIRRGGEALDPEKWLQRLPEG